MKDQGSVASLIGEDRQFQEAYWSFQRIAWIGFAALIALALLGGAGGEGPLARTSVRSGSAVVDAPRIMRWEADDEIRIRDATAPRESIEVILSPEVNDNIQIEAISPAPFQTATTRAGTSYWFFVEPGAPSNLVFHIRALKPALRVDGAVKVGGGPPVPLPITILP